MEPFSALCLLGNGNVYIFEKSWGIEAIRRQLLGQHSRYMKLILRITFNAQKTAIDQLRVPNEINGQRGKKINIEFC